MGWRDRIQGSVSWRTIRKILGRPGPPLPKWREPRRDTISQVFADTRRRIRESAKRQDAAVAENDRLARERRRLCNEGGEVEELRRKGILIALVILFAGCISQDTIVNVKNTADQEPGNCDTCGETADPEALDLKCPLSVGGSDCTLTWKDGQTYTVQSNCDTVPSPADIPNAATGLVYDPCLGCAPHRCLITVGGVTISQKFQS